MNFGAVVWLAVVIGTAWGCLPSGVPNNCDCAAAPSCGGCVSSGAGSYSAYSQDSNSIQQPIYPQYSNSNPSYHAPAPVAPYPSAVGPSPPDTYQPPPLAFDINELRQNGGGNYANPNPTLIPSGSATPQPAESYPSEQYQQMLGVAPSAGGPKQVHQSATPAPTNVQPESASQPPRPPTTTIDNDGTAYREAYRAESVAHFESGDVVAPPPEDLEADYTEGPSTPATEAPLSANDSLGYLAAVAREITEESTKASTANTDNFVTYTQQVCTGVVISKAIAGSMVDVAKKCAEVGCTAANVRATEDDVFEAIFLQRADNRKDNAEFNCISTETVPLVTNDMLRVEAELKSHQAKTAGISRARAAATTTSVATSRAIVIRPVTRASRLARLEVTTKPIKYRFATIEPKSAY